MIEHLILKKENFDEKRMSRRDSLTTIQTQKKMYQALHMFQKLPRASLTSHKSK